VLPHATNEPIRMRDAVAVGGHKPDMGDGFDLNKHAWVSSPATTTIVAAGEFWAKTSPRARPILSGAFLR